MRDDRTCNIDYNNNINFVDIFRNNLKSKIVEYYIKNFDLTDENIVLEMYVELESTNKMSMSEIDVKDGEYSKGGTKWK